MATLPNKRYSGPISCAVFVAGYTIGTAFLIIPASTGPTGIWPSVLLGFLVCLFAVATACLYLEAILANPPGCGFVTICRNLSGRGAVVLISVCFIVISFYFVASSFESASLFIEKLFYGANSGSKANISIYLIVLVLFTFTVYSGSYVTNRVNFILFVAMIGAAIASIYVGYNDLNPESYISKDWDLVFFSVPVILTTFDFHGVLPSIASMLNHRPKVILYSFLCGVLILILYYLVWLFMMLGWSSADQLWEGFEAGWIEVEKLNVAKTKGLFLHFFYAMTVFSSLAGLVTAGLTMVDFFTDAVGLPIQDLKGWKRLALCFLIFFPAMIVGWNFPDIFLAYFPSYIIGFLEIIFICILPIWLVVRLRYILGVQATRFLIGDKPMLVVLGFMSLILIYLEGIQFFLRM